MKENLSMNVAGYLALIAVTLLGMAMLEPGIKRVVGLVLLLSFGVLYTLCLRELDKIWKNHAYYVAQSAIVCTLMAMQPSWGVFPMLFFVLSAQAMVNFPQKMGYTWVGLFTVFTALVFFLSGEPLEAFLTLLPFASGYWFFAAFARALSAAEETRRESQSLLDELQIAHRQLQDYATQVEELAVSEERNRLAREMHDTLGHRLTVAAVQLEGAQRLIPNEPDRAVEMVGTVREQVREALGELRRTVATLREPLQTDISLTHALTRLTDSFQEATGLDVHLTIPEETIQIPNAHRLTMYRAAQEALTNVQRHGQAQKIWMDMKQDHGQVTLMVNDDGIGVPEETDSSSFGLRGLRERALQLNGRVIFGNRPEGGACLQVVLPLNRSEEK